MMRRSPSLWLGALLGIGLGAGLSAAPAQSVEYLRVCSLYGAGWFFVPGTDECIDPTTGVMKKQTVDGTVTTDSDIKQAVDAANAGVAVSLAMPGATVDPGKTFGASLDVGTFGGEVAIGVGAAYHPAAGLTFDASVGAGITSAVFAAKGGLSFAW